MRKRSIKGKRREITLERAMLQPHHRAWRSTRRSNGPLRVARLTVDGDRTSASKALRNSLTSRPEISLTAIDLWLWLTDWANGARPAVRVTPGSLG